MALKGYQYAFLTPRRSEAVGWLDGTPAPLHPWKDARYSLQRRLVVKTTSNIRELTWVSELEPDLGTAHQEPIRCMLGLMKRLLRAFLKAS